MSITRLQQARQMYAIGQLVSKTKDGSRPGYRGVGEYGGGDEGPATGASGTSGSGGQVDTGDLGTEAANVAANVSANMDARDRARRDQYRNLPTPTITVGVDKFGNPINVPTTYTAKRNRDIALDALNKRGISAFDPRVTKKFNLFDMSFAPQPTQKKFSVFRDFVVPVGLTLVNPGLAAKYQKAKTAYGIAKNLANVAEKIGLTDRNVVDAFTSNFSDRVSNLGLGKKSKSTRNEDTFEDTFTGGGDGIGSLENMDALNQEYLLLLEKFNKGVFTDADQVRFTFLQRILGK